MLRMTPRTIRRSRFSTRYRRAVTVPQRMRVGGAEVVVVGAETGGKRSGSGMSRRLASLVGWVLWAPARMSGDGADMAGGAGVEEAGEVLLRVRSLAEGFGDHLGLSFLA